MQNFNIDSQECQLLIVDDDVEICGLLKEFLKKYNFKIFIAHNKTQMLTILQKETIQLIILDIMMPEDDGLELCREIRKLSTLPIIMLTADSDIADKVLALEYGADDYVMKPYEPRELLARIKAVLRRFNTINHQVSTRCASKLIFANWTLNKATHRLIAPNGMDISLSSGDYDLLLAFLEHPQRVLSRDFLMEITRNRNNEPYDRSIDNAVSRLRRKIENDPQEQVFIKTIRAGGYLFACDVMQDN